MTEIRKSWSDLCENYIQAAERFLQRKGHPRLREILDEIRGNLDQRFSELDPDQRTPENMNKILDAAGPPEDFARRISESTPDKPSIFKFWKRPGPAVMALAIILIILTIIRPADGLTITLAALQAALIIALIMRYVQTRDSGFIILSLAVVIWPYIEDFVTYLWLRPSVDRIAMGEKIGVFPFTLVDSGRITIGYLMMILSLISRIIREGLLLLSVIMIARPARSDKGNPPPEQ